MIACQHRVKWDRRISQSTAQSGTSIVGQNAYTIVMESQIESVDISSIKAAALRSVEEAEVWMHPGL
jgi:hypothetical protein